ncbi:unnamed protein product [Phyllotreta striolata]|uniref:Kazal-like domain-containing protein n=1 Tax=Phyllotreta striolata TaxID=444603 RepID=A0A9N9TUA6_PHYSR|nr:unnamed protein product [Phyllotreta striolata]
MKTIELLSVILLLAGEAPVAPQDAQTLQSLLVNLNAKYNCFCPNVVGKVCGSDGTTYDNICFLECFQQVKTNLVMVHEGACTPSEAKHPDECLCPDEEDIVCGSDGKDYRNECEFECMRKKYPRLELVSHKACPKFNYLSIYDDEKDDRNKNPHSGKYYDPDEKEESKLVDSWTSMEDSDIPLTNDDLNCDCPKISQPVCASDGKFYTNMCFLRCYQKKSPKLKPVSKSYCSQSSEESGDITRSRDCDCPDEVSPVCGSDGAIYPNLCLLACQKSQNRALIEVDYEFCKSSSKNNWNDKTKLSDEANPCICSKSQEPVCGTDYRTYPNRCFLECFRNYNATLDVLAEMACELVSHNYNPDQQWSNLDPSAAPTFVITLFSPNCTCSEDHQQACGSDGKTYDNECSLNCERNMGRNLTLAFRGACDEMNSSPDNLLASLLRLPDLPIVQYLNKLLQRSNRCECPQEERPVCGSNGRTYFNVCYLECSREKNPGLVPVAEAPCERLPPPLPGGLQQGLVPNEPTVPTAPTAVAGVVPATGNNNYCNCFSVLQPVCGSDGKTYMNPCFLYCNKLQNPQLYLLGYTVCQRIDEIPTESILRYFDCYCQTSFEPVCASDGRVYPNVCILKCITQYYPHITMYSCELDWSRYNVNKL